MYIHIYIYIYIYIHNMYTCHRVSDPAAGGSRPGHHPGWLSG